MATKFKGIITAMATPLDENNKLNKKLLKEFTNHLIKEGVHGLFPVSSTGESYALDFKQKKEIIKIVVDEANGRIPVYAGTGAITTNEVIELTNMAESVGVDAVSILTPMFIRPNFQELYNHYETIAKKAGIPILLYNNPSRTGINLNPNLVKELSLIDNIVGIKDSSGDMTLILEYIMNTDERFSVLSGRDTLILSTLIYGGQGSIASSANIAPGLVVKIYEEFLNNNIDKAKNAQFQLAKLRLAYKLGTFPGIVKEALRLSGFDFGPTIKPGGLISKENRLKLEEVLKDLNLL